MKKTEKLKFYIAFKESALLLVLFITYIAPCHKVAFLCLLYNYTHTWKR